MRRVLAKRPLQEIRNLRSVDKLLQNDGFISVIFYLTHRCEGLSVDFAVGVKKKWQGKEKVRASFSCRMEKITMYYSVVKRANPINKEATPLYYAQPVWGGRNQHPHNLKPNQQVQHPHAYRHHGGLGVVYRHAPDVAQERPHDSSRKLRDSSPHFQI